MWSRSANWLRKKNMTSWRFSLVLLLFLTVFVHAREPADRIALVVGQRAVTLSEVRAWYGFQTGKALPETLTTQDQQLINQMIAVERLYEVAELYGVFELDDAWFRMAIYLLDELSGYRLSDPRWQRDNRIAPGILVEVMRRNLRVFRFVQARIGLMHDNKERSMDMQELAGREAADVTVTNYLF